MFPSLLTVLGEVGVPTLQTGPQTLQVVCPRPHLSSKGRSQAQPQWSLTSWD